MPLSTPEAKEALKAAIEEATAGLTAKNKELLTELKEARKGRAIDPADVEKLEAKIESLQSELQTQQKAVKEANKANESLQKQLQDETGFTQKLLVDNGLTDALVKNGVAPQYLNAAKAMFAGQAQVVADGDTRAAKIGDKVLLDAIKDWAATDEGKHFIAAPGNAGGGSQGNNGSGGHTPDLSKLSPTERINAAREAKT